MHEDHLTWDWNKQYLLGFVHAFLGVLKPWCFALLQDLFSLSLHSRRSPVEASALFMLPSHDGAYSISYNVVLVQAPYLSSSWPIERSVSFFHPSSSAVIFSLQVQMCSFTCRLPCPLGLYNYFRGDCVLKDQKKNVCFWFGSFFTLSYKEMPWKSHEDGVHYVNPISKSAAVLRAFVVNKMSSNGMYSMLCRLRNAAAVGLHYAFYTRAEKYGRD